MADAKREHEYDVAMATVGYLGAAMDKHRRLDPATANPYRWKPPATASAREEEAREGWALLKQGLKLMTERGV